MSVTIIGLTGGIGSGKSAVAARFARHGIEIIDTDALSRATTAVGGAAIAPLRAVFGDAAIAPDGSMDRTRMRHLVFHTPSARHQLEGILHPLIEAEANRRLGTATSPYVIVDVPLMVETGHWAARCKRVCVVDCPPTLQIQRVMARSHLSASEVEAIMSAQATREERLAIADDIIDNGSSLEALFGQVDALHERYLRLA